MAETPEDRRANTEAQIRWGLNYITGRYGSPATLG